MPRGWPAARGAAAWRGPGGPRTPARPPLLRSPRGRAPRDRGDLPDAMAGVPAAWGSAGVRGGPRKGALGDGRSAIFGGDSFPGNGSLATDQGRPPAPGAMPKGWPAARGAAAGRGRGGPRTPARPPLLRSPRGRAPRDRGDLPDATAGVPAAGGSAGVRGRGPLGTALARRRSAIFGADNLEPGHGPRGLPTDPLPPESATWRPGQGTAPPSRARGARRRPGSPSRGPGRRAGTRGRPLAGVPPGGHGGRLHAPGSPRGYPPLGAGSQPSGGGARGLWKPPLTPRPRPLGGQAWTPEGHPGTLALVGKIADLRASHALGLTLKTTPDTQALAPGGQAGTPEGHPGTLALAGKIADLPASHASGADPHTHPDTQALGWDS